MQTEPAFNETELARRWNVSIKTLQRWRSEAGGPPYIKLSKAVRYPVDEIVTYEQAIRQGMSNEVSLPSLADTQPVVEPPAPAAPEPKRYYLSEAFALIAQYGSLEAAHWRRCAMKPKVDANDLGVVPSPDEPLATYPVLDETQLSSRWNLSPKTLQRWRSEGIGPPAWHLNRSVRYLLMEVESFERKARVTWKSPAGRPLSESSPTAREDAIEKMMRQRPGRRDRVFYSANDVVAITGLPAYWIHQNQERLRLGIPFYRIANGDVIRFSIEELFLWEMHHLRPCRYPARGNPCAP